MNFTDQLQDGLDQLRDALEAFAFALKAVPIQRGHLTVPNDEVTGEYLASLPVGLTLHERELGQPDHHPTRNELLRPPPAQQRAQRQAHHLRAEGPRRPHARGV